MPQTAKPDVRAGLDDRSQTLMLKASLAMLFTIMLSISAQFSIPLRPLGVPFTLQTLIVAVAAMGLGARWGMASMLLYVTIGALGAGVFAEGKAGVAVVIGQTGGYLVGFVVAQPVISGIIRRKDGTARGWGAIVTAMTAGHAVIFLLGVTWVTFIHSRGDHSFTLMDGIRGGFLPYIPGTIIKTVAAVMIGLCAWPHAVRRFW